MTDDDSAIESGHPPDPGSGLGSAASSSPRPPGRGPRRHAGLAGRTAHATRCPARGGHPAPPGPANPASPRPPAMIRSQPR